VSGGIDTITGPGRIAKLSGTDSADNIIGSAGEDSFILRLGADTLDGGDGFDQLRYDRSGVASVAVNLANGEATGTWFGQGFLHQISGIEWVRGSRTGDDQLVGDLDHNFLEGLGGADTLVGGGGNDTLSGCALSRP
jgi:Ca2+-binding RTX toxin-like protein